MENNVQEATMGDDESKQTNLRLNFKDRELITILIEKTGLKKSQVIKLALRELLKNLTKVN